MVGKAQPGFISPQLRCAGAGDESLLQRGERQELTPPVGAWRSVAHTLGNDAAGDVVEHL